jgi:hypothetical protein
VRTVCRACNSRRFIPARPTSPTRPSQPQLLESRLLSVALTFCAGTSRGCCAEADEVAPIPSNTTRTRALKRYLMNPLISAVYCLGPFMTHAVMIMSERGWCGCSQKHTDSPPECAFSLAISAIRSTSAKRTPFCIGAKSGRCVAGRQLLSTAARTAFYRLQFLKRVANALVGVGLKPAAAELVETVSPSLRKVRVTPHGVTAHWVR